MYKNFCNVTAGVAFALVAAALFALLPVTARMVDYGAEGWLWALLGLSQRIYVDQKSVPI
jgi:hypothetical protein